MNQILAGLGCLVVGIVMLIFHYSTSRGQRENTALQTPYLRNGGVGFIIFGLYYLLRYYM